MEIAVAQAQNAILTAQGANISAVISAFAISQDVKTSTRELYRRTLSTFFDWVQGTGRAIAALSVVDLIQYKDELLNAGKSTLTVASYINSIRRFYEWAEANKYYPNIGKGVHAPKRRQQFRKQPLTVAQVGDLLRHEKDQTPRDYALINLIVRTGLRCIEVVRADVGDITYISGQRVLMIHGKGRDEKDNFVILPDGVYLPIKAYLDTRTDATQNAPLFASVSNRNSGGRMTTRAVSGIAKQGLKNVGLDNKVFTAHSLRHTAAVNVLRAGGSREKVQEMLRHANPATTEIYIATIKEEQRIKSGAEYLLDDLYSTLAL